jgi:hypothetical protein
MPAMVYPGAGSRRSMDEITSCCSVLVPWLFSHRMVLTVLTTRGALQSNSIKAEMSRISYHDSVW